jgi:hypothetical protein
MIPEGMKEDLWVGGFIGLGWRWLMITPIRHGICRCTATQQLQAEALLTLQGLLGKQANQPGALFPALDCGGGMVFCRSSPPSCC